MHAAVAGDHFVDVISDRADQDGREDAVGADAFNEILQLFIINDLEGVVFEGADL